ncbi:MAG: integrase [Lachnospiraceae bacterium]|nr:integrase [Lachnospiraceae bacterium]
MPRHKRRTRLPNGYGSICYLGKGRRRPYAAYPCANKRTEDGRTIRPKALGYAETYNEAMELLVLYHKGLTLPAVEIVPKRGPTFTEVYERFYADKYSNAAKQLSVQSQRAMISAFKNATVLHDREFASITYPELQAVLDNCPLRHASVENIKTLFKGMYRYAEKYELVAKNQSRHLEIRIPDDDEHGVPFTDEEIVILWRHKEDETAQIILVMCYSGFRISAFRSLAVNLQPDWYFQGGIKTQAGKDRIVPIHSGIQQIVTGLMDKYGCLIPHPTVVGHHMHTYLPSIGIQTDHTPHDCRHTFSYLCEKYDVPENDRKRLLGHSFRRDITNSVYGHRTVEQLRESIEKIQIPVLL